MFLRCLHSKGDVHVFLSLLQIMNCYIFFSSLFSNCCIFSSSLRLVQIYAVLLYRSSTSLPSCTILSVCTVSSCYLFSHTFVGVLGCSKFAKCQNFPCFSLFIDPVINVMSYFSLFPIICTVSNFPTCSIPNYFTPVTA
jgi:hypothetical protein